jgi:dolichol-phosphate mannosyltransferase
MTVYFLMAAFNEEQDLPGVLAGLKGAGFGFEYKVLLINDGSTDGTAKIAAGFSESMAVEVINHGHNMGLGRALSTGFSALADRVKAGDVVITMDADGSHTPEHIPALKAKIDSGFDIVIASRFEEGGAEFGVPLARRLMSSAANALMRAVYGREGVKDYSSGFRAFSGGLLLKIKEKYGRDFVTESGFTATPEILVKASTLTERVGEIPLRLHYELKKGKSKIKIANTVLRYVTFIFRNK